MEKKNGIHNTLPTFFVLQTQKIKGVNGWKGREGKERDLNGRDFLCLCTKLEEGRYGGIFFLKFVFHRVSEEEKIDENVVSLNGDVLLWFK